MSLNPGRDVQRVGTARFLGQDVNKIHDPVWAVIGNLGDSQCYLGVPQKVQAVQEALSRRIAADDLAVRLIPPAFTLGVSDDGLNGTPQMRVLSHRRASSSTMSPTSTWPPTASRCLVAVVACDKPPVGTRSPRCSRTTPPP